MQIIQLLIQDINKEIFICLKQYFEQENVKIQSFQERIDNIHLTYDSHIKYKYGITIDDELISDKYQNEFDNQFQKAYMECAERGFCDIYCGCDINDCKIRKKGCRCINGKCKTNLCICFSLGMECDPEICNMCYGCEKKNRCENNEYVYRKQARTVIGVSSACNGLGLYNTQPINENCLVVLYIGELISEDELIIRESWFKSDQLYSFIKNDYEKLTDSKFFGNKIIDKY
ncbi:SET domain protein [Ichthyophthirius multifiliis]|uniref:SET domain protein n=1 Tax=Ichthyophthirius multifiliis TaxID=5932 RepID=G0QPS4_ICHMU|nr:SET domain protein [Ichthyophthirius multifiliis]EGR32789.1 SET domain protein [Ichthyophthirius multifiliis]|eukprot:XP_004036775.1 SET domain protein [Ichthyophthirius multifiliis]